MKGIILAGGAGTRLFPATLPICKQLLPIYDKPMIYYPLSMLMLAGIRDILIISTPHDTPIIEKVFKNGSHLGLNIKYAIQESPNGLAESFIIGEDFIKNDSVALILGDNIFYGNDLSKFLKNSAELKDGGIIFGYKVRNPSRYGVAEFDELQNVINIEEKPKEPKSNCAICGLYFYDNDVIKIAKNLKPSNRGELEITDVNVKYLQKKKLKVKILGRGYAWLDTGTCQDFQKANVFVQAIEERQEIKIACIEEIALNEKFINLTQFKELISKYPKNDYGNYVRSILNQQNASKQNLEKMLLRSKVVK